MNKSTHPISVITNALEVIKSPQLSEIYATTLRLEGPTVGDISDHVDCALSTVYRYLNQLETMGFVRRLGGGQPYRYEAVDICVRITTHGEEYRVKPLLIIASAQRTANRTLDEFVEEKGVAGLARALESVEADVARESRQDGSPVHVPESVYNELRDIVVEHKGGHSVTKSIQIHTNSSDENQFV